MTEENLYKEPADAGTRHRELLLAETHRLLKQRQEAADADRKKFFQPDLSSIENYERSLIPYRERLSQMLGWPLCEKVSEEPPHCRVEFVAEDSLARISRIWIEVLPDVHMYGLFFQPHSPPPHPFVISQHGGNGTPELCSDFFGSRNYNDMTRRIVRKGFAVFAPQMILWMEEFGPVHKRLVLDKQLKQVGSSMAALELFKLRRSLDYFCSRDDVDSRRIGMAGLSYGGFYTLFATALDTRIQAALSSCYFNDRKAYPFDDWVWFNSAGLFTDPEIASMVCPRPLYIETGIQDHVFAIESARPWVNSVTERYRQLNLSERFTYHEHPGTHEFSLTDEGLDFLCRHL